MPPATRVWDTAVAVRDAVVDGFGSVGIELPARRLVTPGLMAWDCEMLAVQVERIYQYRGELTIETPMSIARDAGMTLRAAQFAVTIIRCVPVPSDSGRPPSVTDEETATQAILVDQQVLWNSLLAGQQAGVLASCNGMAFDDWRREGPQGGMGGGTQRFRLSLVGL